MELVCSKPACFPFTIHHFIAIMFAGICLDQEDLSVRKVSRLNQVEIGDILCFIDDRPIKKVDETLIFMEGIYFCSYFSYFPLSFLLNLWSDVCWVPKVR